MFGKGTGQVSNKINAILAYVLMTAYALNNYQRHNNYYALFEAWAVLAAAIVRFSSLNSLNRTDWQPSLNLAMVEIQRSLQLLKQEMLARPDFLEGDWMGDGGIVYRARATMVLGAVAALEHHQTAADPKYIPDGRVIALIEKHLKTLWYWGESAFPFFLHPLPISGTGGRRDLADPLRLDMFEELLKINSPHSKAGVAPYHYSAPEIIENLMGISEDRLDMRASLGVPMPYQTG